MQKYYLFHYLKVKFEEKDSKFDKLKPNRKKFGYLETCSYNLTPFEIAFEDQCSNCWTSGITPKLEKCGHLCTRKSVQLYLFE